MVFYDQEKEKGLLLFYVESEAPWNESNGYCTPH